MKTTGNISSITIDYKTRKPILSVTVDVTNYEEIEQLKNEELLDVEIKKHRKRRSLDSNAYFHVLINKLARVHNISDEEMKVKMVLEYGTIAKNKDGIIEAAKVPKGTDITRFYPYARCYGSKIENGVEFDTYIFYERTHLLNTAQMAKLIDGVVSECKEVGIETLPPNELKSMIDNWHGVNAS